MTGARWVWTAAGLLAMSLLLGLGVVWCNIERYDLAYKLTGMREQLGEAQSLVAKLEVERDNLVSPHRLRDLARRYGLSPASQGGLRRLSPPGRQPQEQGE